MLKQPKTLADALGFPTCPRCQVPLTDGVCLKCPPEVNVQRNVMQVEASEQQVKASGQQVNQQVLSKSQQVDFRLADVEQVVSPLADQVAASGVSLEQVANRLAQIASKSKQVGSKSEGRRRGGLARAAVLTPERRSEIARKARASHRKKQPIGFAPDLNGEDREHYIQDELRRIVEFTGPGEKK